MGTPALRVRAGAEVSVTEPVVMSGSSLNTYLRCARQWEFAYVHRIKRPPSLRQALGTSGHYAIETDLKHKVKTWEDLPREEVIDLFVDAFKSESVDSPDDKAEKKGEALDSGVKSVKVWYDTVAPSVAPLFVEVNGQFTISSIPYDWTADLVDQDLNIRDWKFVTRKPSDGGHYVLNMVGYAIGYREKTGGMESGVQLDHIVRTQKPYHYPLSSGPVQDSDIEAFSDVLTTSYRAINTGVFPPTGLQSNACSWCGYKDICKAYKERT
jgi:CRISPR/Cas system-associated exonuclease Cas4 (RecB family)